MIHAFEIDKIFRFEIPLDPFKSISDFRPPQSFCYIDISIISAIIENTGMILQNQSYQSLIEDSVISRTTNKEPVEIVKDEFQAFER